ncbi:UNVERIFIED_CONTAM: hypothetical protein Sradi_2507900 [Sesamum radiatum]|uniref:Uncharacterized protein n=1 Tax=Sesamum radiatum TaxID=300843 RepID=A0AAW2SMA8_SESRA
MGGGSQGNRGGTPKVQPAEELLNIELVAGDPEKPLESALKWRILFEKRLFNAYAVI